jgi:hypothetical protein
LIRSADILVDDLFKQELAMEDGLDAMIDLPSSDSSKPRP